MTDFFSNFSNREISVSFWLIIVIAFFAFKTSKELLNLLKTICHYKIILPLFTFFIYCLFIIYILKEIHFWKYGYLKDTIIWLFSSGIIVFFNINNINKTDYFINILKENLKVIIFLEFLLNFYTFNLLIELIFVPIITLIVIVYEYSKYTMKKNPEHIKVNKILSYILSIIVLYFILNSISRISNEHDKLFTLDNVSILYLPIILTMLSFPFYYFLAILIIYEEFFIRINFMFKNEKIKKEVKKQIILKANFKLNTLTKIRNKFQKNEIYKQNIGKYIKSISE